VSIIIIQCTHARSLLGQSLLTFGFGTDNIGLFCKNGAASSTRRASRIFPSHPVCACFESLRTQKAFPHVGLRGEYPRHL